MLRQTSERNFSPVGCVLRDGRETISGRCFDIWKKTPTMRAKVVDSSLAKILRIVRGRSIINRLRLAAIW